MGPEWGFSGQGQSKVNECNFSDFFHKVTVT